MDHSAIAPLLLDLKSADELTRDRATQKLWHIWFHQKGVQGFKRLEECQILLEAGDLSQSEALLTELIEQQPDFSEAWNRRAVLYYIQEKYGRSLLDCQKAIALNPTHFGAWHGMGLCHIALSDYKSAIHAFRHALEIQPYSLTNQRLLLECTMRLSR